MDIFVIRDGLVVPYIQQAYLDQYLPVLPPEVHYVRLSWMAMEQKVQKDETRTIRVTIIYCSVIDNIHKTHNIHIYRKMLNKQQAHLLVSHELIVNVRSAYRRM